MGGVPAKKIGMRFSEKLVKKLKNIDVTLLFDSFDSDMIKNIYSSDEKLIERILEEFLK